MCFKMTQFSRRKALKFLGVSGSTLAVVQRAGANNNANPAREPDLLVINRGELPQQIDITITEQKNEFYEKEIVLLPDEWYKEKRIFRGPGDYTVHTKVNEMFEDSEDVSRVAKNIDNHTIVISTEIGGLPSAVVEFTCQDLVERDSNE